MAADIQRQDEVVGPGTVVPVYVIHWRAVDWCLSAVESLLCSSGVDARVRVVNNSPELSAALRAAVPVGVDVIDVETNRGYTGGANIALRHVAAEHPDAPVVVLASHDLHVRTDALAQCLRALDDDPGLGIVGPYVPSSSNLPMSVHRELAAHPSLPAPGSPHPTVFDVEWISGQCLVMRRQCARDVGEFDERLGSYCEDVDYGRRARLAGWRVGVCAGAEAHGLGSASPRAWSMIQTNTLLVEFVHHGATGWARALVARVARAAVNLVGAVALWRPADRRRASWARARAGFGVVVAAPRRLHGFRSQPPPGALTDP